MSQMDILKRAMIAVLLAGTAATLLMPRSAPASSFHTVDPMPAAVEEVRTPPDFPAERAMLVPKGPLRVQYVPIELSKDRLMPTAMFKG